MNISIQIIIIIILIENVLTQESETSLPCHGSFPCLSTLTQQECALQIPKAYIEIDPILYSCCPICRSGLGLGSYSCRGTRRCAPGLECSEENTCELKKNSCAYTYHLQHLNLLPTCEIDGTFTAKQCKGGRITGRCFCYNEFGSRIYGVDWWTNAEDMTCACSRQRDTLERNGRPDVTLHCESNGNYETLQCDSGVCWCADKKTGQLLNGTRAVPETLWKLLPCYSLEKMGEQYLRECETGANAQALIRQTLANRGTLEVSFNNIQCDYDGNYGVYSIQNGIAICTWRDGTRIGSYGENSNLVSQMNCNCARDVKYFEEAGFPLTLICFGNGNYNPVQNENGIIFCVDRDGFIASGTFETVTGLECNDYFYYMQ